jgi:hypothetical protein
MRFPQLKIEISSTTKLKKSRAFKARLLGYLTADALWEFGTTASGVLRPVWLAYFNTVGESKPFTANLRAGRNARIEDRQALQVPRSSGHRWATHIVPGGLITVAYLPELFHLEPPVPFTDDARFVMAPRRAWVDAQAELLEDDFGADARDAARAALFGAYLDRRTPLPLLRDLAFHLQLYRAALEEPWVVDLEDQAADLGLLTCGLDAPVVCSVDLETLGDFLTRETSRFHEQQVRSRPRASGADLDLRAAFPPVQLALDLGFA